jgi:light-regulated signal transduction histidine kinase (bacteriophytochrome)
LKTSNEELAAINKELEGVNQEYLATNDELFKSNGLLIRSNENLQQFAYVASHDLQEPLRKIQSFGDLLKTRYNDELGAGLDFLLRIQAAAARMSVLIDDLLNFSQVATSQETDEPVQLSKLVRLVLTDLEVTIQQSGAKISVGELPEILGEKSQLSQLFQNLLSNAIKFHKPDMNPEIHISSHTLDASMLPESVNPSRLARAYHRIDITDNGIGFNDKYAKRIFQVFQRLHGKNEYSGTGIGLAICEKVAASHGGAITASSQINIGSTFSVYLPVII